jgi:hypothetical protein
MDSAKLPDRDERKGDIDGDRRTNNAQAQIIRDKGQVRTVTTQII